MRLLLLTIVTMGGLALMLEFVLVDTVRIAKGAQQEPVQVTFQGAPGSQQNGRRPAPSGIRRTPGLGEDEVRAGELWRSQRATRDVHRRRQLLRTITTIDSSYRGAAERALRDVERALRAAAVGKQEGRR